MLKKLLTLCLALVMLSTVALASPQTYVLAAETETIEDKEAADVSLANTDIEVLVAVVEGENIITKGPYAWKTAYELNEDVEWLLIKAPIGEDWVLDADTTFTLKTKMSYQVDATAQVYVAPLSATTYSAALDAAGDNTAVDGLVAPSSTNSEKVGELYKTAESKSTITSEFTGERFGADSYADGCLYMAVEFKAEDADLILKLTEGNAPAWSLEVNGYKSVEKVVNKEPADPVTLANTDIEVLVAVVEGENIITKGPYGWTTAYELNEGVEWLLIKAPIGEDWVLDADTKFTLKTKMSYGVDATAQVYVAPLSATTYSAALGAAGDNTDVDGLDAPSSTNSEKVGELYKTAESKSTITSEFTGERFGADSYADGCLYMAVEFKAEDADLILKLTEGNAPAWSLVVEGNKYVVTTPAVDDFSDAVIAYDNSTGAYTITTATTTAEAYLIIASYTGDAMNDVELVSINAAEGLSGSVTPLDAGTIKIFLLDKATLAPAIGVTEPVQN